MQLPSPPALQSAQLPCGRTVKNRLAKVALYEHLALFSGGPPNEYHFAIYSEWAKHDWGMVFTGNVQVSNEHLTFGRDITLPDKISEETLVPYRHLASLIQGRGNGRGETNRPLAIMQLSHAGRQSMNLLGGRGLFQPPLGPSPIRVGSNSSSQGLIAEGFHRALFSVPKEMTLDEVEHAISRFVYGAKVAHGAGFDGVEIHAAHGYLVAQFISPKSNKRTDQYSLAHGDGLQLLHTIVSRIRAAVPANFVIGVKLNVSDYSDDRPIEEQQERALNHILTVAQWGGIDFIELSGGDYETPEFISASSKSKRQAFFSNMSQKAVQALEKMPRSLASPPLPLIMLTGGLRTPALIHAALASGHAQLVGIGRTAILCPDIPVQLQKLGGDPSQWPNRFFVPEPTFVRPKIFERPVLSWLWDSFPKISLIGAGVNVSWYEVSIRYLAEKILDPASKAPYPDYSVGGLGGVIYMWTWTAWRATTKKQAPRPLFSWTTLIVVTILSGISSYCANRYSGGSVLSKLKLN